MLGPGALGSPGHLDERVLLAVLHDGNSADRDRIIDHNSPDRFLPAFAGQQFQLNLGVHLGGGNTVTFTASNIFFRLMTGIFCGNRIAARHVGNLLADFHHFFHDVSPFLLIGIRGRSCGR